MFRADLDCCEPKASIADDQHTSHDLVLLHVDLGPCVVTGDFITG